MRVLLRHGPGDGQVVDGRGETVVWGACLYERTGDREERHGHTLVVFRHRPDCCEPYGRGSEDRCE
ncbi:hypothetical protein ACGFNF_24845 [Micromonospora sp. NPDC048868]|uniref:hypothetical protein n=1 Tax=Micromonospora sp. NPDC048868 TaxID=3364258 RepID=UPI0037217DDA